MWRVGAASLAAVVALIILLQYSDDVLNLLSILNPVPWHTHCTALPSAKSTLGKWPSGVRLWWHRSSHSMMRNGTRTFMAQATCPHCMLVQDVDEWHRAIFFASPRNHSTVETRRCNRIVANPKTLLRARAPLTEWPLMDANASHVRVAGSRQLLAGERAKQQHLLEYREKAAALGLAPLSATLVQPFGRPLSSLMFQRGACHRAQQTSPIHCPITEVRTAQVGGAYITAVPTSLPHEDGSDTTRPTALLLEYPGKEDPEIGKFNPYHTLFFGSGHGNVWCVAEAVGDLRRVGVREVRLLLSNASFTSMSAWKQALLAALLPVQVVSRSDGPLTFQRIFAPQAKGNTPSHYPFAFEIDRAPSAVSWAMPAAVLAAFGVGGSRTHARLADPGVLMLQRSSNRVLVGSSTGQTKELVDALCADGIGVRLISFDKLPLRQQVTEMANAAVVIAVHGAHLANLIWMAPQSTLVEVTMRFGWCCNPMPPWPASFDSCAQCTSYHVGCYANLANAFGLRYVYVDPEFISPHRWRSPASPIERHYVYVNARDLSKRAAEALHTRTGNGMNAVTKYEY
jgi:hypothetical protein